jgi:hypothetical protein
VVISTSVAGLGHERGEFGRVEAFVDTADQGLIRDTDTQLKHDAHPHRDRFTVVAGGVQDAPLDESVGKGRREESNRPTR